MSRTYTELLDAAKAEIDKHNAAVGEAKRIDFEKFKEGLVELGGTSPELLRKVSWEDLQGLGLPKLVAKAVADIFRQDGDTPTPRRITQFNVDSASPKDLVDAYDPRNPTNIVGKALSERSKGQAFVVFDRTGGVHRKLTLELFEEILAGDAPRENLVTGGQAYKVYRVGELPTEAQVASEHPLYPGEALRRDGTDKQGLNWSSIPIETQVLLRLAVGETREIAIRDARDVCELHKQASAEGALAALRTQCPKAALRYEELSAMGRLPSLKVAKGSVGGSSRNTPFHGHEEGNRRF